MLVKISKRIIGDLIGMKKNKKLDNIVNYQNILNKHVIKVTQSKIKRWLIIKCLIYKIVNNIKSYLKIKN